MRIDAYTHFFPAKYFQALVDSKVPDIGKRVREVPAIHDLDVRRKVVDSFPDYRQIICVALPPIGTWTPPDKAEGVARLANDGLKELCDKYPDQFAGFVAEVPLTAPDAGARESERAIKELGACGVQIVTNVNGKPLDRPEFEPFFAKMNQLKHAGVGASDAHREDAGLRRRAEIALRDLVDLRLVLRDRGLHGAHGVLQDARQVSGPEDPRAPFRRHRADARRPHRPGLGPARRAHLGRGLRRAAQVAEEAPDQLFQGELLCRHRGVRRRRRDDRGKKFYPLEKIVFASDCPFDPEKGPMYIRETLAADREDGLDQGRARAGVLQEPGADHGEDVCEAESRGAGPRRRRSEPACRRLRPSAPQRSLLCVCPRASPRSSPPRPRPARRPRAARRQDHHGRQGLARRAGGRDPDGRFIAIGDDEAMAGHIGPNTQVDRAARQDRRARPDRHASASAVRRAERPGRAAARRAHRRRRAEGDRRARRAHASRAMGDGLVRLAREHPRRRPDADAP